MIHHRQRLAFFGEASEYLAGIHTQFDNFEGYTAVVTSETPDGLNATSSDVFVTNGGDMLTATGAVTLTPVPGSSSEFTENATLTITGGSGKYKGASGTITLEGQAVFDSSGGGTFDVIYQGSVCGSNLQAGGN